MYEVSPQQMHQATCALPEHFRRLQHQHKELLRLQNRGPLHLPSVQDTSSTHFGVIPIGRVARPQGSMEEE